MSEAVEGRTPVAPYDAVDKSKNDYNSMNRLIYYVYFHAVQSIANDMIKNPLKIGCCHENPQTDLSRALSHVRGEQYGERHPEIRKNGSRMAP